VGAFDRERRELLRRGFLGMGMLATGRLWLGCGTSALDLSVPAPARDDAARERDAGSDGQSGTAGAQRPMRPRPPATGGAGGSQAPRARPDAGRPLPPSRPDASVPPARDAGSFDAGTPPDAGEGTTRKPRSTLTKLGPLLDPDANGLRLPAGFSSRVVARSGELVVPASSYVWHPAPDGGATFRALDGGFVYVSNCEWSPGGAGALRFDAAGELVDAYPILQNTARNCAGGPTPWGNWLSCEEWAQGAVWECDPLGVQPAVQRPALGLFRHEAAAVDPQRMQVYLTEDEPNGRLYRFTPGALDSTGRPDLQSGVLEVAQVQGGGFEGRVAWLKIMDPSGAVTPTRLQVEASTPFNGAEGIWHHDGVMYFATKGDSRVWAYDLRSRVLTIVYDIATSDNPILSGVDNVTVSPAGDVLVAEDTGGDMQIVGLAPDGTPVPLLQVVGHDFSEIAGPAFDPSGTRLYFSSQRGATGLSENGVTFEVTGPFFAQG
jgi:hypothetical protein